MHQSPVAVLSNANSYVQTQGVSSPLCISKLKWINNQQWQSKTQLYL